LGEASLAFSNINVGPKNDLFKIYIFQRERNQIKIEMRGWARVNAIIPIFAQSSTLGPQFKTVGSMA
jgi:hypothetical protein